MSTVKTTIKCDVCAFSEFRIYPGRGKKVVSRDGKVSVFIGRKFASLFEQRIKPVKLTWTQAWRRMNKKGRTEVTHRRRAKRTAKVQRAIVGLALDEIKRKRAQKPELKAAASAKDSAIREAKKTATRQAAQQHQMAAAKKQQQKSSKMQQQQPKGPAMKIRK